MVKLVLKNEADLNARHEESTVAQQVMNDDKGPSKVLLGAPESRPLTRDLPRMTILLLLCQ
jgi:hypothetical protein